MADFITWEPAQYPTWFQRPWGEAWALIDAVMKDVMVSGAKDSVKQRFIEFCKVDALFKIGRERQLPTVPNESYDDYRVRLLAAWDTWLLAGTKPGVALALSILGYTVVIVENGDGTPPDGNTAAWWRFWVYLTPLFALTDDGTWDSPGVWDDGLTWDSTVSLTQLAAVRHAVHTWKAAHTVCMGVQVNLGSGNFTIWPLDP